VAAEGVSAAGALTQETREAFGWRATPVNAGRRCLVSYASIQEACDVG
jgi:hypothetical protein